MLPVALDAALGDWRMEAAKFVGLPLLVGLPLGLSWRRMPPLGQAFVLANFISKLGALGGLYLAAPIRLCAYYRLDQQQAAGWALIGLAAAVAFGVFLAAFCGWSWARPAAPPRQRWLAYQQASQRTRRLLRWRSRERAPAPPAQSARRHAIYSKSVS